MNDEKKVFATIHGPYPIVSPDPGNPDKYVYDGFGTFADILPGEEKLLQAALRAQMDYTGKWG